jgi:hypothetical protein
MTMSRRFRLVKLETSRVAPAAKIHDLGRLSRRPGGLGRLHDIEPIARSRKNVCGREFHCTLPSIGSLRGHEPRGIALCAASHLRWSNVKLGHPAALRKVSLHTVK